MGDENDVLAAPNWLGELERKREYRVKTKLGHEAGAGAACLKCGEACPGLDLHFWRKICKNCKCAKDSHDVPDDDTAGWAQFQLLGSKVKKTRIVLPGKKDEVELEWTPKGPHETIDKYLKTIPMEELPVKGSQAAQERKQLLQKQIPVHDVDPALCHELTEQEHKLMVDYIEQLKAHSVGIGQIVEYSHNLQKADKLGNLNRNMEQLSFKPVNQSDISTENREPIKIGGVRDLAFSTYETPPGAVNSANAANLQNYQPQPARMVPETEPKPHSVNIGPIRDICFEENANKNTSPREIPEIPEIPDALNNYHVTKSDQSCGRCKKPFIPGEFAILAERCDELYHPACFTCFGCNQSLADLVYFMDAPSGALYCGRDYPKIRGIPRCRACDELIFTKQYCIAENDSFHLKHFCCFECDIPLAGSQYVIAPNSQPVCLLCDAKKADRCLACGDIIKPDEQGARLEESHFHATGTCFACFVCRKPLLGQRFMFKNRKLYCSRDCYVTGGGQ